jgi:hypothetical protein
MKKLLLLLMLSIVISTAAADWAGFTQQLADEPGTPQPVRAEQPADLAELQELQNALLTGLADAPKKPQPKKAAPAADPLSQMLSQGLRDDAPAQQPQAPAAPQDALFGTLLGGLADAKIVLRDHAGVARQPVIEYVEDAITRRKAQLGKGRYHVTLDLARSRRLRFQDLDVQGEIPVKFEDVQIANAVNSVAIDLSGLNFSEASYTSVAQLPELRKCKDWDYPSQACRGAWVKLADLVPGQEYTILLSPEDPGFGEFNSSLGNGDLTTTSATPQNASQINFTPILPQTLLIGYGEFGASSTTVDGRALLVLNQTETVGSASFEANANVFAGDFLNFFTHRLAALNRGQPHNLSMQFNSESAGTTTTIRRARAMMLGINNSDAVTNETGDSNQLLTPATTTHSIVNVSYTPSAAQPLLVLASAELAVGSTTESIRAFLRHNGTDRSAVEIEGQDAADIFPYGSYLVYNAPAGVQQNFTLAANAETTANKNIRRARLTVAPLNGGAFTNESQGISETTSATPINKTFLFFSPSVSDDYLVLASADVNISVSGNTYLGAQLFLDDVLVGNVSKSAQDITDDFPFIVASVRNVASGAHTLRMSFNRNGTTGQVAIRRARISAIPVGEFAAQVSWESETAVLVATAGGQQLRNATVYSQGSNANVAVFELSGNGTSFISASPVSLGTMGTGTFQNVEFNCSPSSGQAMGTYSAVYRVNSTQNPVGDNITVSCTVSDAIVNVSVLGPTPGQTFSVLQNSTFTFNVSVSCAGTVGSCGEVRLVARRNSTSASTDTMISHLLNETPLRIDQSLRDNDIVVTLQSGGASAALRRMKFVNGAWQETILSPVTQTMEALDVDDADNDGLNEIVVGVDVASGTHDLRIFDYNESSGTYRETNISTNLERHIEDLEIGDADNDGRNDIVIGIEDTAGAAGAISYLRKYSFIGGTWQETNLSPTSERNSIQWVEIGDADNDGLNEVVALYANVTGTFGSALRIFKNASGFWIQINVTGILPDPDDRSERMQIGDVDNDGLNEIVAGFWNGVGASPQGRIVMFSNHTSQEWIQYNITLNGRILDGIDFGDVNDDGLIELAATIDNSSSATGPNQVRLYRNISNTATGIIETNVSGFITGLGRDVFIGDANNDGRADVVGGQDQPLMLYENVTRTQINSTIITFPNDIDSADVADPDDSSRLNNISCTLAVGQSCQINYTIAATGAVGTVWSIDLLATGDTGSNDSAEPRIRITDGAGDTTPPTVHSANITNATPFQFDIICLMANVSDGSGVQSVNARVQLPNASNRTIALTDGFACNSVPNDGVYSEFMTVDLVGVHNWTVTEVQDVLGNAANVTAGLTFDGIGGFPVFADRMPPNLSRYDNGSIINAALLNTSNNVYATQNANIAADTFMSFNWTLNLTDNLTTSNVTLEHQYSLTTGVVIMQIRNGSAWQNLCTLNDTAADSVDTCILDPFVGSNFSRLNSLQLRTNWSNVSLAATQSVDNVFLSFQTIGPPVVWLGTTNGVFFDGFESGSLANWSVNGTGSRWANSTTDPFNGTQHAQAQQPGAGNPTTMRLNISTLNFTDISVRYARRLVGIDAADEYAARWYNGTNWTNFEATGGASADDAAYVVQNFTLPAVAANNALFAIEFMCEAGAVSEFCRVDDVRINGTQVVGVQQNVTNVTIAITDSPDAVSANSLLNYTIALTAVSGNASNITLTQQYPAQVVFNASQPAPLAGTNDTFVVGNLTAGQSFVTNITVLVGAVSDGVVINTTSNLSFQNETGALLTVSATEGTTVSGIAQETDVVIFEPFEQGFAPRNWTINGTGNRWNISTENPFNATRHANVFQTGAGSPSSMRVNFSTANFTDVRVSYSRKLVGLDAVDEFKALWFDGATWRTLEELNSSPADDSFYIVQNFTLGSTANNNPGIVLEFMCEAGAVSEACRVDDVRVNGSRYAITIHSPLPGSVIPNRSLTLNYTASLPSTCLFELNNKPNVTLVDNANTTFTAREGLNELTLTCNTSTRTATITEQFTVAGLVRMFPAAARSGGFVVTGDVSAIDGIYDHMVAPETLNVTEWTQSLPASAQSVVNATATCLVAKAQSGAQLHFAAWNGTTLLQPLCIQTLSGSSAATCDLTANGIDTVEEINNLDLLCVLNDTDGGPSANLKMDSAFVDVIYSLGLGANFEVGLTSMIVSPNVTLGFNVTNASANALLVVRIQANSTTVSNFTLASNGTGFAAGSWLVPANATLGAYSLFINDTNESQAASRPFTVLNPYTISGAIKDSDNNSISSTVKFINASGSVLFSGNTTYSITVPYGTEIDMNVTPDVANPIREVVIYGIRNAGPTEDPLRLYLNASADGFGRLVSLDPGLQFSTANISFYAQNKTDTIFKCANFDFETQECIEPCDTANPPANCEDEDTWTLVANFTFIENVTSPVLINLSITATDPGFADGQSAARDGELTTTSTTAQNVTQLNFSTATAQVLLLGYSENSHSATSSDVRPDLVLNQSSAPEVIGNISWEPNSAFPNDYYNFFTHALRNISTGNVHNLTVRFSAEAGTSRVRNARAIALPVNNTDAVTVEAAADFVLAAPANVYHSVANLSFTPSVTRNLLVIASAELWANSTSESIRGRLTHNGTAIADNEREGQDVADIIPFATHSVILNATAGVQQNFSLQVNAEATANKHYKNARITIVPLDNFILYNESEPIEQIVANNTIILNKSVLVFNLATPQKVLILAYAEVNLTTATTGNRTNARLEVDGVMVANITKTNQDATDDHTFMTAYETNLLAGTHSVNLTYKLESAGTTSAANAAIRRSRIAVIPLAQPSVLNATTLAVSKLDLPDVVNASNNITYQINVTVTSGNAFNLTVNDTYPSEAIFLASQPAPFTGNNSFLLGNLSLNVRRSINITLMFRNVTDNSIHNNTVTTLFQNESSGFQAGASAVNYTVVRLPFGLMGASLVTPVENITTNVSQNGTFTLSANITCSNHDSVNCGNVTVWAQRNNTGPTPPDWFDTNFTYRRTIVMAEPQGLAQNDTHVLINVDLQDGKLHNENGTILVCGGVRVPWDAYAVNRSAAGFVNQLEGLAELNFTAKEVKLCQLYYDPTTNATEVLPTQTGWNFVCDNAYGNCGTPGDVSILTADNYSRVANITGTITCGADGDTFTHNHWCYFRAPVSGNLSFATSSDDGSDLFLNGTEVVNNRFCQGTTCRSGGQAGLVEGRYYRMRVSYDEQGGGNVLNVAWNVTTCTGGTLTGNFVDTECFPYFDDEWQINATARAEEHQNFTFVNISTLAGASPLWTSSANPQSCVLVAGQSCQLNWTVNATASNSSLQLLRVNATSNESAVAPVVSGNTTINTSVAVAVEITSNLSVLLLSPPPNVTTNVTQNLTFTFTANITCIDGTSGCGNVTVFARYNFTRTDAARINRTYSGTANISAANQLVSIGAVVNNATSMLFFSVKEFANTPSTGHIMGRIFNTTHIEFDRPGTATPTIELVWYVAEFLEGVTARQVSVEYGTSVENLTEIGPAGTAVNVNSSFILPQGINNTGSTWGTDDFIRLRLVNATHAGSFASAGLDAPIDIAQFQVVEFNGSVVQRGLVTLPSAATTVGVNLTTPVQTNRSFLLFTYAASGDTPVMNWAARGRIVNSTNIEFSRNVTGADLLISWEVVDMGGQHFAQHGVQEFGVGSTEQNVTLTPIELNKSVAFSSSAPIAGQSQGTTNFTADDVPGMAHFTHNLTNATQLRLRRELGDNSTASVGWFVIQFSNLSQEGFANISTLNGATPFFTTSANPQFCLLGPNEFCQLNWTLNATGTPETLFKLQVNASSNVSVVQPARSDNTTIRILRPNVVPTIAQVILNSTNPLTNDTNQNLTAYVINATDADLDPVKNITDWRANGNSIALVNMPFEGGSNGTFTRDYSLSGRNGTVSGALWNQTSGFDGFGAYDFDSATDFIEFNTSGFKTGNMTFMAWVRAQEFRSAENYIFGHTTTPEFANRTQIYTIGGTLFVGLGGQHNSGSGGNLTLNRWRHVAVSFNDTNFSAYIDGVLNFSGNFSGLTGFRGYMDIGNDGATGTRTEAWNGTIDEVYVFNRALSAEQIYAIFANRTTVIVANETVTGEVWQVCVTPNDRFADGATVCSNNLTIGVAPAANVSVINISPSNGATFLLNESVNITVNATTISGIIDVVLANITLPNGTIVTVQLLNETRDLFNYSWVNLTQRGMYNITYFANDTFGNTSGMVTTFFLRKALNVIDVRVRTQHEDDENLADLNMTFANYSVNVLTNTSGMLNLSLTFNGSRIKTVNVTLHDEQSVNSILDYDDWTPQSATVSAAYAIEPGRLNFANLTVTVNATGLQLLKCGNWNFTGRQCDSGFTPLRNITPGTLYSFSINATDPAFAETTPAIDVALAPYDNTTFAIAFITNTTNALEYRLVNTNGTVLANATLDATMDTDSRVALWPVNFTHAALLWIDGPDDDLTRAILNRTGTNTTNITDINSNIGLFTDVGVGQMGDRFPVCYAHDTDNDLELQILNNSNGNIVLGETQVDANIDPSATLQDLTECTGINQTRGVAAWFDDSENDVSYRIFTETGAFVTGITDVENAAGEFAQVDSANLNNDRFAIVFYDFADQDVRFTIISADGAELVAPTNIDTLAGTESRVAATAVRVNETATRDSLIAVWFNQSSSRIMAAVFNETGGAITAPFTVDNAPNSAFQLLDVAARDPVTGNSLCPGKFVVAYSNSTNQGVFKGFDVNGSSWDGSCPERLANTSNVSVIKTDSPDPVNASSNLSYVINVTSTGSGTAFNVTVNDTYPNEVIFLAAQPTPVSGTNNTFVLGNLTPNQSILINITVLVQNISNGAVINNTANVTFRNLTGVLLNVSATANTTVRAPAPLVTVFREQPDGVGVSTVINVRFVVWNNESGLNITAATLTDDYPPGWQVVGLPSGATDNGNNVTFTLGPISTDGLVTVNYSIRSNDSTKVDTFSAYANFTFSGANLSQTAPDNFSIQINSTKAFFDVELDLEQSTLEINRTIFNSTPFTALLTLKHTGSLNITNDIGPVQYLWRFNRTLWNVTGPSCAGGHVLNFSTGFSAINCSYANFTIGEIQNITFTISSTFTNAEELTRSNTTADPPVVRGTSSIWMPAAAYAAAAESAAQAEGAPEVVKITGAQLLDENGAVKEDITDIVREQDGSWTADIAAGGYVRATFERNLTANDDITVTARGTGAVEIYGQGETEVIAGFGVYAPGTYKSLLHNLSGSRDAFDLKVASGSVAFDQVVDPSFSTTAGGVTLTLTKVETYDPVPRNTFMNFTISVNVSAGNASNVTLTDNYPGQVIFIDAQPAPVSGTNNTFILGNITTGLIVQANITVLVLNVTQGTIMNNTVNISYQNDTGSVFTASVLDTIKISDPPIVENVTINTTLGNNLTDENITVYFDSYDLTPDPVTANITDWLVNNQSILLLYMPFESNESRNESGLIRDYSSPAQNGTLGAGNNTLIPAWNLSGQVGGAYVFDGTNDYIQTESTDLQTADDFTITVWVKLNTVPLEGSSGSFQMILWQGEMTENGFGPGDEMHLGVGRIENLSFFSNDIYFYLGNDTDDEETSGDILNVSAPGNQTLNWTFIAVVVSNMSTAPAADMYINGVFEASDVGILGRTNRSSWNEELRIGRPGAAQRNFNGTMDEVLIFNRSLSAGQIYQLYIDGNNSKHLRTIHSDETVAGEVWQTCVIPHDSFGDGNSTCSNTILMREFEFVETIEEHFIRVRESAGQPDLQVNDTSIFFNNTNPREGENITINATVCNIGTTTATGFNVSFSDGLNFTGVRFANLSNFTLAAGACFLVNATYLPPIGNRTISVLVDPENVILEINETNNNATRTLNVQAYTFYFGNIRGNLTLADAASLNKFTWTHIDAGFVYFHDTDSQFNFSRLQALGRNTTNGTAVNDFGEANENLNMSRFNDSVQFLWATDNSTPRELRNLTIFSRLILSVPVINSTNSSAFFTGILWDTADDTNGQYDISDKEDLVFITNINLSNNGQFKNNIDYEARVPSLLRAYRLSVNQTAFQVELN